MKKSSFCVAVNGIFQHLMILIHAYYELIRMPCMQTVCVSVHIPTKGLGLYTRVLILHVWMSDCTQSSDELHCSPLYFLLSLLNSLFFSSYVCVCVCFFPPSFSPPATTPTTSCLTARVYPEYQCGSLQIDGYVCHMTLYVLRLYPGMTAGRYTHIHKDTPSMAQRTSA